MECLVVISAHKLLDIGVEFLARSAIAVCTVGRRIVWQAGEVLCICQQGGSYIDGSLSDHCM